MIWMMRSATVSPRYTLGTFTVDSGGLVYSQAGIYLKELRVDGGPTRNKYLMQFQSDILDTPVACADAEELSGIGAAYMAGLSRKILQ